MDPRIAEQEVVERVEGAGVGDKNGAGRVAQGKAHLVSVLAEAGLASWKKRRRLRHRSAGGEPDLGCGASEVASVAGGRLAPPPSAHLVDWE